MKLIYIAGDDRSGSTMLDMMLSGHSEIVTVGECHHLKAYAMKDKRYYKSVHEMVCYCGQPLDKCSFWTKVEEHLKQPLESLELKPYFLRQELRDKPIKNIQKKILWVLINAITPAYSSSIIHSILRGSEIGRDSRILYEAVTNVTGCSYVLDSSKDLHRMYSIAKIIPDDIKIILLCRDHKGTISSKVKRGIPLLKAAYKWKWTVNQMEYYSKKLRNQQILRVRYEDICKNTEKEMRRICDFLDLEFQDSILTRNCKELHHLGGSPSKYINEHVAIKYDNSYVDYFTSSQRKKLFRIVKKEANIWGYTK